MAIILLTCINKNSSTNIKIQNSRWLFYDFNNCQDILAFKDSVVEINSCESLDTDIGEYWVLRDTVFVLFPIPKKEKIMISGDSVEIFNRIHEVRPTLLKFYLQDDTLHYFERIDNYHELNQSFNTYFEPRDLVRLD